MAAHLVLTSRVSKDGKQNCAYITAFCLMIIYCIVVGGLHIVQNDDHLDVESSDGWLDSSSEIKSLTGSGLDAELTESNTEPSFTIAFSGSATEQHPVSVP